MDIEQEKIYANALNQCLQIGPVSLKKIREHFGNFKEGYKAPIEDIKKAITAKELEEFRKEIDPEKEFKILEKEGIRIFLKDEMPENLRETPVAPEILYIKGSYPFQKAEDINLAVVGTRRCSSYGQEACEKIVSELTDYGIAVISGLAIGIDAIAHKTALKNKIKTIAILGSGLRKDVLYPRQNIRLSEEIVESGGCLISEYSYSMKAAQFTFPQRNRIVAGMAKAVWVVEAPAKSGALITAFLAIEYNREVFSLPGSIFAPNSKGTNNLLKLGSLPVTNSDDILRALGIEPKTTGSKAEITPAEMEILSYLYEPLERDELIRKIGKPAKEINPLLTQMEIKGIIKEIENKLYKLSE